MAGISTSIEVVDRVTGSLNRITAALNNTTASFAEVDRASDVAFNPAGVQAVTQEMYAYEERIHQVEADLVDVNRRFEQMQKEVEETSNKTSNLENAFGKVGQVVASLGLGMLVKNQVTEAIGYASDLTEVQNVVDTVYGESAESVNEWAKNTLDAYGLNELSAKKYVGTMGAMLSSSGMAGDKVQEMSQSMVELAGDMASFYNLDAEDAFNKIRSGISGETEPLKQLGIDMSATNMEAYALSQGITTSYSEMDKASQTTLRYAYLMEATANAQGDFARTSDSFSNQTKLLKENWTAFTGELASKALPVLAQGIGILNDGITVLADNWEIIAPILTGALTMIGLYLVYANAAKVATTIWTVAQAAWNAVMAMNPIMMVILAIVALIAIIYAVVAAINKWKGTTISATGIIMGAFAVLGAFIANTFILPLWNRLASFINFFGNLFNDPVASIKVLFYDFVLDVIGYISSMAEAIEKVINKIPGVKVDITSGLDSFEKQIEEASKKVKDESGWVEYATQMEYIEYEDAAKAGYAFGEGIDEKISSMFSTEDDTDDAYKETGAGSLLDGINGIGADTSEIADGVNISSENLKYLRDIAEKEAVNQFTTAEIKVDMTNNNNISSDVDLDGIITSLSDGLLEAMAVTAEGVH